MGEVRDAKPLLEAAKRRRRKNGPWTAEDEAAWIADHPEDAGTPHFVENSGAEAAVTGSAPAESTSVRRPDATPSKAESTTAYDADLVPDLGEQQVQRTDDDDEIDRLIESLGIVEAYTRWCGKSQPKAGGRTEGIKVSCPNPTHPDKNPSAWLNAEKNVWVCGSCGMEGGDIYDIAAWHFGFPVPGYKQGKQFHELRERIAQDLGFVPTRTLGGKTVLAEVHTEESDATSTPGDPGALNDPSIPVNDRPDQAVAGVPNDGTDSTESSNVHYLATPDFEEQIASPKIEWGKILPYDSFMYEWMTATSRDDLPEEYYFWLGLQALGLALGNDVFLNDMPPVKGNLFVVLYGRSGLGKSRSVSAFLTLLREALPYDYNDEYSTGAYIVPSPASAEALIDSFSRPVEDSDGKILEYAPVRGLLRFDEFATLIGRSNRMGNPIKPTLMEFFDSYHPVELRGRGAGLVRAENHFCSTVTTTQPRAIRDLLVSTDVDSGFINRWIFAAGPEKQRRAYGGTSMDLTPSIERLRSVKAWAALKPDVDLTGAALDTWDEFFHQTLEPERKEDDSGLLTRTDLTLKKIILLLAANAKNAKPTQEIVENALSLWPYLKTTYTMLSGEIGMGPVSECHHTLVNAIVRYERRNNKAPTVRELVRLVKRHKYPIDLFNRVLAEMIKLGEVEEQVYKPAGGGKAYSRLHYAGDEA